MWPFGSKKVASRLAAASQAESGGPVRVSTMATIVSGSAVTSPFTGMPAVIVVIEVVERVPLHDDSAGNQPVTDIFVPLGFVVLGDLVTLRDGEGDEITIVSWRARIRPATPLTGGTPLTNAPPEVVPLLKKASGRGVICHREHTLSVGDTVRLDAVVEPTMSVASSGYRSGTRKTYVAREDLAPVVLEEVFETPAW